MTFNVIKKEKDRNVITYNEFVIKMCQCFEITHIIH